MEDYSPRFTFPITVELGAIKSAYPKAGYYYLAGLHLKDGTILSSLVNPIYQVYPVYAKALPAFLYKGATNPWASLSIRS